MSFRKYSEVKMLFGLSKSGSVVEELINGLSIPMFYKFDGVNKYITNSAFDEFFGSSRKKALDFISSYSLNPDDNFELEVENDIGKKISSIVYISSFNQDSGDRLGLLVDISEQKRAKEAVEVLKDRYELATSGSNEGLWDWNIKDDNLFVSSKFKEILKDRADELDESLKSFISLIAVEDVDYFIKYLEEHLNGKKNSFKCEFRIKVEGKTRWFLARAKAVERGGVKRRVVGFLSDISDIKFAQLALKEVIALEMKDKAGGLNELLLKVAQAKVNFNNANGRIIEASKSAILILDVPDIDESKKRLTDNGIQFMNDNTIYGN